MKKGKKLGSEIQSIRDFAEGVCGIVGELRQLFKQDNTAVVGSYGQNLYTLDLVTPTTGEITTYWADGGLRGALKMAKVNAGDAIFVTHTGETEMELEDGRKGRVQKYEICAAE